MPARLFFYSRNVLCDVEGIFLIEEYYSKVHAIVRKIQLFKRRCWVYIVVSGVTDEALGKKLSVCLVVLALMALLEGRICKR